MARITGRRRHARGARTVRGLAASHALHGSDRASTRQAGGTRGSRPLACTNEALKSTGVASRRARSPRVLPGPDRGEGPAQGRKWGFDSTGTTLLAPESHTAIALAPYSYSVHVRPARTMPEVSSACNGILIGEPLEPNAPEPGPGRGRDCGPRRALRVRAPGPALPAASRGSAPPGSSPRRAPRRGTGGRCTPRPISCGSRGAGP